MDKGSDLRVGLIQTALFWEDRDANLNMFAAKLAQLEGKTDLAVLPEMFTTGFSMRPEKLAEQAGGKTLDWMRTMASEKNMAITGSLIVTESGNYYNRLYVVFPEGSYKQYDKRHLFRMGEENKHYTGGVQKMIFTLKGWRIFPLICYDLRFPVWSRNRGDYDLLIYVANWPESRRHVWNALLVARALENQCYVTAVNRIGKDGQQLTYAGDSVVVHPKGHAMSRTLPHEDTVETVTLSMEELERFRKKFPVAKDADDFVLK
jgi:predicted amidohydrolase